MEFKAYQKELELQSRGWIPTFHDVSKEVIEIVQASGVKNGTVCIASHHTTCSVMIQECSHDLDKYDLEYLQHDILDIIKDGVLDGGEFAHIYFVDWDCVRARHRQLNITVMGTTEDVEDRKWNNGEVINTLRKYTDEEKAYDVHYTLQQKR